MGTRTKRTYNLIQKSAEAGQRSQQSRAVLAHRQDGIVGLWRSAASLPGLRARRGAAHGEPWGEQDQGFMRLRMKALAAVSTRDLG